MTVRTVQPSASLTIEINDTGTGIDLDTQIDEQTLSKILDVGGFPDTDVKDIRNWVHVVACSWQISKSLRNKRPTKKQLLEKLAQCNTRSRSLKKVLELEWFQNELAFFSREEVRRNAMDGRWTLNYPDEARLLGEAMKRADRDIAAIDRLTSLSNRMIENYESIAETAWNEFVPKSAEDLGKQYIAASILRFWRKSHSNRDVNSKRLTAFAGQAFRLFGYDMQPPTIEKQLVAADRRLASYD